MWRGLQIFSASETLSERKTFGPISQDVEDIPSTEKAHEKNDSLLRDGQDGLSYQQYTWREARKPLSALSKIVLVLLVTVSLCAMAPNLTAKVSRNLDILANLTHCGSEPGSVAPLWPLQTYKSSPIQTPYLNVTKLGQTEPGLIFLTTRDNLRDFIYPAIYSDDGELVWQGPKGSHFALQPQVLDDEPVLVYWEGKFNHGFGHGHISILNSTYDEIHRVTLDCEQQNIVTVYDDDSEIDSCIDLHENQLTENGTILAIAINVTQADLTSVGGPKDGWIQDGIIYEIDIKTNKIVFRWSAYEHINKLPMSFVTVPLGAPGAGSGNDKANPWGYPHLNSVAKYGDSYLLSSRNMCGAFLVAPNGSVTWNLHGQTGGDFNLGLDTSFCYQHDVRVVSGSPERVVLSLHNNDNDDLTRGAALTTGMVLEVELTGSKNVTLKRRMWDHLDPVFSVAQGGFQSLPNGHVLLGHGAVPRFEEFDADSQIVMRAYFGYDSNMESYRAYRSPWVGRPSTKPDVIACPAGDGMKRTAVFMSWNGATDVESWKVYSGSQVKGTAVRNGFETAVVIDGLANGDSVFIEAVGGVGSGVQSATITVGQGC
ncbi:uncharacterized protein N7483_010633 [Penicillium malachiteum]|uniref:uncharacterized protein n=1 Tax=Penicillium malachiteum TaxID=1324776 RepID=UPI0025484B80|nr:uncharacterized protein N7483_010633 [Penicillium malachiteum]KAJ5713452.1 hypothetical protein N7483_010633 [Penicillium malachiteum]